MNFVHAAAVVRCCLNKIYMKNVKKGLEINPVLFYNIFIILI